MPVAIALLVIILMLIVTNIFIVPQSMVFIVERFGKYQATLTPGLHLKVPIADKIARKVSLKEHVADFEPCSVITKDNVTMHIDTVVFFRVMDPKMYTYKVENPIAAIEALCATTLRNIVGGMNLDDSLTSRDTINGQITAILDDATDQWGIKITRVEVKNIVPPSSIQDAMEKQMKAEREKRAVILQAEGEKQAAITTAEGEKASAILKADAIKEKMIREAEGHAKAVELGAEAEATAIRKLNEAKIAPEVLQLRKFETMAKVADGQATKLIIPSELTNITSAVSAITETAKQ